PQPEPEPEPKPAAAKPAAEAKAPAPAEPQAEPKPAPAAAPAAAPDGGEHRFSPAVTMLAEERGVDLARVTGTGIGGRVTKRDVRQFLEAGAKPAPAAQRP